MSLDELIAELQRIRVEHGGQISVRVFSVYAAGTNDGAEVSVSNEKEYTSDTGENYIIIR